MRLLLKERYLNTSGTAIVGIVNVTPDSFFSDSRSIVTAEAVEKTIRMLDQGAVFVDIGGESTRPGSTEVSPEVEISRVIPVIRSVKSRNKSSLVSIDTRNPQTAEAAFRSGADILNDVTGLRSEEMIDVASRWQVPVIVMHMKGTPQNMQDNPTYDNVVEDIIKYFETTVAHAVKHGIKEERVILDPGIGFGKTHEHNLKILASVLRFKQLGFPVMIGHSRKSMIGKILDTPVNDRLDGTLAITAYCATQGVDFVRVHDVLENLNVVKILKEIAKYPLSEQL